MHPSHGIRVAAVKNLVSLFTSQSKDVKIQVKSFLSFSGPNWGGGQGATFPGAAQNGGFGLFYRKRDLCDLCYPSPKLVQDRIPVKMTGFHSYAKL